MEPYYADERVTVHAGDCLDVLRSLPDSSVDAVVTDPPYGLEFMGKEWDGADGFRRSLNPADAGRESVFGRASRTSPEYRTDSKAQANRAQKGGHSATDGRPTFLGGLNPKCQLCEKWQRGANPCKCESPVWSQERLVRLHTFQEWAEAWSRECLRVLKPGGHMLAFGGTRTWHRLACAVEDAGFEVRDSIAWLYGSGFPKSLDVSKAIDKAGGDPLAFRRFARAYSEAVAASPLTHSDIDHRLGIKSSSCYWAREDHRGGMPPRHHWERVRDLLGLSGDFERLYDEAEREVVGFKERGFVPGGNAVYGAFSGDNRITAPATPDAERWQGWGTALKPAFEPVVVARKPLAGTVAANVLTHGTGALNIDGCRVGLGDEKPPTGSGVSMRATSTVTPYRTGDGPNVTPAAGRWPANVVLDESQAMALDEQSGELTSNPGTYREDKPTGDNGWGMRAREGHVTSLGDSGGASRFFYVAKADASERVRVNGTAHPTVKPLALMRWLVRLVTPPGGTVLEPFAGSGTTVEACLLEGFRCIAIEREDDYLPLIRQRINRRRNPVEAVKATGEDGGLFDLLGEESA